MRTIAVALLLFLAPMASAAEPDVEAAVKLLAEPADGSPDLDEAVLEPWPSLGEDRWVVAAYFEGDETLLKVGVLRKTANGFRLVARGEGVEPETAEPPHKLWLSAESTTFRISPSEEAIALHVSNSFNSTARSSSSGALHLFRLHGDKVTQIFAHVLSYSGGDKADYDDEGNEIPSDEELEEFEEKSVVFFSKTKTKGFYNLVVRDLKTKKTTTYRWDGREYIPR
ncbi:MAG TPA: hypothetical protein VF698_15520 [Thermoanaerobaculia bacterium]|jgi:hypothetical protein